MGTATKAEIMFTERSVCHLQMWEGSTNKMGEQTRRVIRLGQLQRVCASGRVTCQRLVLLPVLLGAAGDFLWTRRLLSALHCRTRNYLSTVTTSMGVAQN